MTDPDLRGLLTDAVADVEPSDRLEEIRSRVAAPARRSWRYVACGAVLAGAATVAAVVVLTGDEPASPPVASPPVASPSASAPAAGPPVAVYYVGDTPRGPRLFREWRPPIAEGASSLLSTLTSIPLDPDYRTLWPPGSLEVASDPEAGLVHVTIAEESLAERPGGMSEEDARLALQQVVYTVRAAHPDERRLAVRFWFRVDEEESRRATTVLGLPAGDVAAAPALDVLSHVSVSDPAEGRVASGTFTARGIASSPEANVPWELLRGDDVVASGFASAEGWLDRLYPWETTVDVSDLDPGEYTFVARTADDSEGEGPGPDIDTRTVVVE